jgi:hypothetical protein
LKKRVIIILLTISITSCFNPFSPKYDEKIGNGDALISNQKSIEGVFQNFSYAYTFQDTSIYGKLLAGDFQFTYHDYENGVDVSWNRDEDMRITNSLFNNTSNLDLVWNKIISISEDSSNVVRSFNLTVTFNPTDVIFVDGRVNLLLKKDDSGKWLIENWIDDSNFK